MTQHFLRMADLTAAEHARIFARARALKQARKDGHLAQTLAGKTLVLVFEKASTRTRLSFEAAMFQLGGHAIDLPASQSQLGRGEPLSDTAKIISGYADAVVFRTHADARLAEFAEASRVPVINGLSDGAHPVQVLADVFTLEEHLGPIAGKQVAFVGDGSSNMARSFCEAARLFDFDLRIAAPQGFRPPEPDRAGARVRLTGDPAEAVDGADAVVTDVWTSMGQEAEQAARLAAFEGFCVDAALIARAKPGAIVLHCLPAHRGEEISAEVIDGPQSIVWAEAENRLHVQKALLELLLT